MHLYALVIPVRSAARVGNLANPPAGRCQGNGGRIHIARRADGGINQRRPNGMQADEFLAHQKARHVEIMDHHIPKQPARAFDIRDRRRGRIARGDDHQFHRANIAPPDARAQGGEIGVKPAVEPCHEGHACGRDGLNAGADIGHGHIDGLFTENRLARFGGGHDLIEMAVRGRADDHAIHIARVQDRVHIAHLCARAGRQAPVRRRARRRPRPPVAHPPSPAGCGHGPVQCARIPIDQFSASHAFPAAPKPRITARAASKTGSCVSLRIETLSKRSGSELTAVRSAWPKAMRNSVPMLNFAMRDVAASARAGHRAHQSRHE
jgi:hypothetical protein